MHAGELRSGDALFSFDEELLVHSWNRAAEELIGLPAEEAVGRPCWEVLAATDPDGAIVCHRGCPYARLVREGGEVRAHELLVRSPSGPRPITLSTIALTAEPRLFLHLMHPARQPAGSSSTPRNAAFTPRQVEVLGLLAQGLTAKAIATQLGIAVSTVRKHIRDILHALDAHSQLEALAKARRDGVLQL